MSTPEQQLHLALSAGTLTPESLAAAVHNNPSFGVLAAGHPDVSTAHLLVLLSSEHPTVRQAAARRRADDVAAITAATQRRSTVPAARGVTRIPPAPRLFTRPRMNPEAQLLTAIPEGVSSNETVQLERGALASPPDSLPKHENRDASPHTSAQRVHLAGERDRAAEDERPGNSPQPWSLVVEGGQYLALPGDLVVLGRRPVLPSDAPGAAAVRVVDVTRTVSKTHAMLRRTPHGWEATDLHSTNGVLLDLPDGTVALIPGVPTPVSGPFWLGDLRVHLQQNEGDDRSPEGTLH